MQPGRHVQNHVAASCLGIYAAEKRKHRVSGGMSVILFECAAWCSATNCSSVFSLYVSYRLKGSTKVANLTMKEAVEYLSSKDEMYQHWGASYIQHNTFIDDRAKEDVGDFYFFIFFILSSICYMSGCGIVRICGI